MAASVPLHQRWIRRLAGTRGGAWLFARVLHRIDRFVSRITGGRRTATAVVSGLPVVLLTTTGARSGLPRTVPVLGFPIGADLAVAAGNFGRAQDPGWCVNLGHEPRAQLAVGGRRRPVVAEELTGGARDDVWARAIDIFPAAAAYERRAGARTIRVFLLRGGPTSGRDDLPVHRAEGSDAGADGADRR
jgi:deazaflavin-dependent oxidoreductase (nitroreductase family)